MAVESLEVLKARVVHRWKPLVVEVKNWLDSFRHKNDAIAISEVTNLQNIINILSGNILGNSAYRKVTGDYTATLDDCVIAVADAPTVDPEPAPFIISLPNPATCLGKEYCVKRYSNTDVRRIIINITIAADLLQNPYSGEFLGDFEMPETFSTQKSYFRWKSNGQFYEVIS